MSAHTLQAEIDAYVSTTGLSVDIGGASSNDVTADTISEITSGGGVTVDGVLLKDGTVSTDTISEDTAAAGVTIDGVLLKDGEVTTDTINEETSAAGVTIDSCLIKDGRAAALATAAIFLSSEQTGTGSSQDVAHGFGAAPTVAVAIFSELDGNAADIAYGTHDATNVKITATSGQKFFVLALK